MLTVKYGIAAALTLALAGPRRRRRGRLPRSAASHSCAQTVRSATRSTRSVRALCAIAPPFRSLHRLYPVESLEEALAEGISTGHPTMPEFRLDPGQIGDVIAYLKSLER